MKINLAYSTLNIRCNWFHKETFDSYIKLKFYIKFSMYTFLDVKLDRLAKRRIQFDLLHFQW